MLDIMWLIIQVYISLVILRFALSLVFWASVGSQLKKEILTIEPNNIIIKRIRGRGL